MTYERARKILREIVNLPPNWDGYGAEAPHPDAISYASQMLGWMEDCGLPGPDEVVPTASSGSVRLTWNLDRDEETCLDIGATRWTGYGCWPR